MGQSEVSELSASEFQRLTKLEYGEAAEYLGVSVRTLERAKVSGTISFIEVGRRVFFTPEDLDEFRAEYLEPPATYVQPTLPGMEHYSQDPADAPFSEKQAAGVARALDRAAARRARRSLEDEAVA